LFVFLNDKGDTAANELQGKVALIAGGSNGIGLAIARRFAVEGAYVGIVSRSAENLAQARDVLAAEGLKVTTAIADLSDPEQAEHAVAQIEAALGPVDILSAGRSGRGHAVSGQRTRQLCGGGGYPQHGGGQPVI